MEIVLIAFFFSLIAGLSTTIGSIFVFIVKEPKPRMISFIMGFSCGIMLFLSFVELLQQGIQMNGVLIGTLFFLGGMIIMLLIDMKITHFYEYEDQPSTTVELRFSPAKANLDASKEILQQNHNNHLKKTSLLVALGVFIHNFPEGMATFIGTLKEFELGVLITIAIALHNIPEGIVVATTVSLGNDSKFKPFLWSFITGLSEPLGALIVWLFLFPFVNDFLLGILLSVVGGIMMYISLDELLPMSRSLGKEHLAIFGIVAGMFVMSLSLAIIA